MSTGLTQRGNVTKPKPLQASTNIIHTKISKNVENIKTSLIQNDPTNLKQHDPIEPIKRKSKQKPKQSDLKGNSKDQFEATKKVDHENDVSAFVTNAYNPLSDIYPFDEELYEKVLKLELADDGLPKFDSEEPFDF